jgi:hypothetical protein
MIAKILGVVFAGAGFFAASCRHYAHNRMVINDGVTRTEIRYNGDIGFNDEETAISRISRGGYVDCWRNEDHLLAGSDRDGVVLLELHRNGKPVDTASAEGKAMVARVIRAMLGMGFDIEGRMDRLYRRGGYAALLNGTDSVDGDYVRGRYFERILDGDSLSADIVAAVMNRIKDKVGGDYDKNRLLEKVDTIYLKNDSVSEGYLAVVRSMNGDYERSQALQHFLRISLAEGRSFDSLLRVVGAINGDYEKSGLLNQIAQKNLKEGGSWAGLIRTTTTLGGEYERSNVLVEIGQRMPKADSLRLMYMNAAKTIHSDNDYGRVVKAVER